MKDIATEEYLSWNFRNIGVIFKVFLFYQWSISFRAKSHSSLENNQSEAENAVNEQNSEESIILQEDFKTFAWILCS